MKNDTCKWYKGNKTKIQQRNWNKRKGVQALTFVVSCGINCGVKDHLWFTIPKTELGFIKVNGIKDKTYNFLLH